MTDSTAIALFDNLCPNCRGMEEDVRLSKGLPCKNCLPEGANVCQALKDRGTLKFLSDVCKAKRMLENFESFFRKRVGEKPWSLQLTWAKRVFIGRSFAIQAPTGIGKTTFGVVMASYIDGKSYIILPTKLLVEQVKNRLLQFAENKRVVAYTGKKKEKNLIEAGEFDILVSTQAFLQRNVDILLDKDFKFIFVDDVDSVLKNPKNVDNLFKLMGFTEEEIEVALSNDLDPVRREALKQKIKGVLVVSSATLKPKTKRVNLFRNILGFDIQRSVSSLREVEDFYIDAEDWEDVKKKACEITKFLGEGVFLFVPTEKGKTGVEELVGALKEVGIGAVSYEEFSQHIEDFKEGRIQVAVGIAISNNALVRGVDLPYWVRAAVFAGVPKFAFPLKVEPDPPRLFQLVRLLSNALKDERLIQYLSYLKKYSTLKKELLDKYPPVKAKVSEVCKYVEELLERDDIKEALRDNDDLYIEEREGEKYIVVGDATSYIQASGRTSRLIPGGITKGLSVVVVDNRKAFSSLSKRVRYLLPAETTFKRLESLNVLIPVIEELDKSRDPKHTERKELFKSVLVIVESPNKARTISNFFGRPQKRWLGKLICYEVSVGNLHLLVTASVGHVADLTTSPGFFGVLNEGNWFIPVYTTIKRCSCGNQFTDNMCPKCKTVDQDKLELLETLRRLAFEVDEVYIATDPDAEGEKIAWDLFLAVSGFSSSVKRVEFHEVTPSAFKRALQEKRTVDMDRVKAQIVRRIADRWVGFTLSQRLQMHFNNRNLSAGRVQTPVLGWVIERDEEAKRKKGVVRIWISKVPFTFEADAKEAKRIYSIIDSASVSVLKEIEEEIKPPPPFSTSELLKEASSKLKLSADETMKLAQRLFEEGYITYHRTDSTRVSSFGMAVAKDYIEEHFPGNFKPRVWETGGAHECIRPTRAISPHQLQVMKNAGEIDLDQKSIQLYRLIFNRFIASQMKEAKIKKAILEFKAERFCEEREVITDILEPGFTLIHPVPTYKLEGDLKVERKELKYVPMKPHFTEGSLVDEMKKRGLGRPSTYAKIVNTIIERGYVLRRGMYLVSTPLGRQVFDYLSRYKPYTTEEFTRTLEEYMDEVEERKKDYMEIIRELYSVRKYLPQNIA